MASYAQMCDRRWCVYVLAEEDDAYCKIGSAVTPKYRLEQLQSGNPRLLRMVEVWTFADRRLALEIETLALANAGLVRLDRRDWLECPSEIAVSFVKAAIARAEARISNQKGTD